jgi:uncharacterized membrane protein YjgN (DUF898 family)
MTPGGVVLLILCAIVVIAVVAVGLACCWAAGRADRGGKDG